MRLTPEVFFIGGNRWPSKGGYGIVNDMHVLFGGDKSMEWWDSNQNKILPAMKTRFGEVMASTQGWWPNYAVILPKMSLPPARSARIKITLQAYQNKRGAEFPGFVALRADGNHYAKVLDTDPTIARLVQQVVAKLQPPSQEVYPSKTEKELHDIARAVYSVMHNDTEPPAFLATPISTSYNPKQPTNETMFFADGSDYPSAIHCMAQNLGHLGLIDKPSSQANFPDVFGYASIDDFENRWTHAMRAKTALAAAQIMLDTGNQK